MTQYDAEKLVRTFVTSMLENKYDQTKKNSVYKQGVDAVQGGEPPTIFFYIKTELKELHTSCLYLAKHRGSLGGTEISETLLGLY